MKKKKILSERDKSRRLMQRWTLDVANRLMTEGDMTRRGAFQQAYLLRDLMEALGRGVVHFVYETKDGERREARGTLCHGISEAYDNYEYKEDSLIAECPLGVTFQYWDLDREAFRTFSADRVIEIKDV